MKSKISLALLLISLFSGITKSYSQFATGISVGYYHNLITDFKFKGSAGTAIHALYRINKIRFGANLTFIKDMKLDESWALSEFNRNNVLNNTAKLTYDPAISALFQFNVINRTEKVNLFLGGEIGMFKYRTSGAIEMGSSSSSTTVGLDDEERGGPVAFARASLEVKPTDMLSLFTEFGLPIINIDDPIINARFGLLFYFVKSKK